MATGTARQQPATPSGNAERFIERQLSKTRLQVRTIDLISGAMTLFAGVVAFLLVLAIIDHWVLSLSWWSRWLAFLLLMGSAGCYIAFQIVPLMLRPINPVYAAKAIEEVEPALKNSLINFLLFRQDRQAVPEVVYSALEQRAATDLKSVPIDNAVDRAKLIYVGYVLAGVLALGAAYKILSPKDPFQSASRVAAPWADIDRPSRVWIGEVAPGDAEVFQGELVEVSAIVEGKADSVLLYYSTADGEIVDQAVEMKLDSSELRYECVLPNSDEGLRRELSYRIEAGDATTTTYQLKVSPAPNIVVERLEYVFPSYTRRSQETLSGQGDIKALEGTRVTIRAKANQTIRSAFVELDSVRPPLPKGEATRPTKLPMEFDGREASRVIVLELQEDRKTPLHSSYQIRFTTESGRENLQPILHRIEVIPDLAPEVEILTPAKEVTEVPADGVQKIEIRALDPDFGLKQIALRAVTGGAVLVDESLFVDQAGAEGQTVRTFQFRPANYDLQVGARVTYRATAEDNRTALGSDSPEPNPARTRDYQLLIVPPLNSDASGASSAKPEEDPTADPKDESKPAETEQPSEGESGEGEQGAAGGSEGAKGDSESGEQQEGGAGGEGEEGESGESSEGATGQGKLREGSSGEKQGTGDPQSGKTEGGTPGEGTSQESGEPGQSGAAGERTEEPHDGEVFEKALERIKQKMNDSGKQGEGEPSGGAPEQDPSDNGEDSSSASGNTGSSKGGAGGEKGEGSADDKLPNGDEKPPSQQETDPKQSGEGSKDKDNNMGAGGQKQAAPGEGGSSKKDYRPTGKNGAEPDRGEKPDPPGPKDTRKKDPGTGDSGDAGAGQNSEEKEGSGSVESAKGEQVQNGDKPKSQNPDSSEPQEKSDGGASADKKQSDSKGEGSGDRNGGGEKGAGQGANQAGNDSPGQNSAADEGAGKAAEAGEGETSDAPGQKQESDGPTGSAGTQKGEGSDSRKDPSGDTSATGTQQPQPQPNDPHKQQGDQDDSNSSQGGPKQGGDGVSTGGGSPSDNDSPSALDKNAEVADGDEANLDYARRTTDMVLDYLKDQKNNPDTELLDELGWTEEELAGFLKRWQQLKQAASEDNVGQRELDESLRSLGLRPKRDRSRKGATKSDYLRGLRDSGSQSTAPAGYQKLIDAFKKGAARSSN
ncbi:MAG: hypothetical protein CMJ64_29300 [Planctomycetaceae bacterium]|nr:hypothetical protein [Planctomycetaceae bacterium]